MKITVIGSGYVGLVSGACFAELGNEVLCLDIDQDKVNELKGGKIPIYEPGLQQMILKNREFGRLDFTTDIEKSVEHGYLQFIAVGTPSGEDGSADLNYVLEAAKNIGKHSKKEKIIINKSTVPVGTCQKVKKTVSLELKKRKVKFNFYVVSNPEFLKEGSAVNDFTKPDRIIIGVDSKKAEKILRELYSPINRYRDRLIVMDQKSAELTKYASNTMLATRISFMNELSNLAEKIGADIEKVRLGVGSDPRIGSYFLYPGCGYGGSCFPKDIKALQNTANKENINLSILESVEKVNEKQKIKIIDKIEHLFDNFSSLTFAIWGLAFKPNTDDIREAPSLVIIKKLLSLGAKVVAYDPVAANNVKIYFHSKKKLNFSNNPMSALQGADALIILTEWKEFASPNFEEMYKRMKRKIIFDGRNIYDPEQIKKHKFNYFPIGRAAVTEFI